MISEILRLSGTVSREDVRDIVLRYCVVQDDDGYDGDDSYEAGNHIIAFYTALFVDTDVETILEGEAAEEMILDSYTRAYRSRLIRGLASRGIDRNVTLEDAREAFFPNDTFSPDQRMPSELATKLGMAMGDYEAGRSLSMHDYVVANG